MYLWPDYLPLFLESLFRHVHIPNRQMPPVEPGVTDSFTQRLNVQKLKFVIFDQGDNG